MSEDDQRFRDLTSNHSSEVLGLPTDPTGDATQAAQTALLKVLDENGPDEVTLVDKFIWEAHGNPIEDHAAGSRWLFNMLNDIPQIGGMPPGVQNLAKPVTLDDRFWDLAERYKMYDTDMRFAILSKLVELSLKEEA